MNTQQFNIEVNTDDNDCIIVAEYNGTIELIRLNIQIYSFETKQHMIDLIKQLLTRLKQEMNESGLYVDQSIKLITKQILKKCNLEFGYLKLASYYELQIEYLENVFMGDNVNIEYATTLT